LKLFFHIGRYLLFLKRVFSKPEKARIFRNQVIIEIDNLGIDSLGIVAIISVFMGAIVAIQTAFQITNPLIPQYTVGFATRQSMILEFSPTIVSLILAGKVGSRISSEIGTMRITEQIDALEIMGINSAEYLVLPKILASVIIFPVLVMASMFLGVLGGWFAVITSHIVTTFHFMEGIRLDFHLYDISYAMVKTICFAFIISTISGYYGYFVEGGSLELGKASTKSVVQSSIYIILFNLIITEIFLA
jgi:phospholipid/cholesterol/gamma-HCH transport system permease protein